MMKEIWKPCVGFEGFYEVSNYGNVRSIAVYNRQYDRVIRRKMPKTKAQDTTVDGYKRVLLSYYGIHYHCAVHRLVAQAFIPNPDNLPCINHKDECTSNNIVSNLEWCTHKYNSNYGTLPRRIKERMQTNHPTARKVAQYDRNGNYITTFNSLSEAARSIGIRGENITRNIQKKYKHAGGYIWKYVL